MGNLISFMKDVADGLRESGNYGTAHIYRSSMSHFIPRKWKSSFSESESGVSKKFRNVFTWKRL